jgi:hypothetical protein
VLGIISVVGCAICGPFAYYYGKRAEDAVDASRGTLGGRSMATAGKILGIIGCVFLAIGIIYLIVVIAVVVSD